MTIENFQSLILHWHKEHNRRSLPWRQTRDPYKILVSEIMLQQTQVSRVLQKYPEFLKAFPTIRSLANTPLRDILGVWQGMGYNRRALYLQKIAKKVMGEYRGKIPSDTGQLQKLSGIGSYSAGAIACFAFAKPVVFLDTNIRKVYIHFFWSHGNIKGKICDQEILKIAKNALYHNNPREWHWALMDYGALELGGDRGILEKAKAYYKQSPFLGSTRYFRSKIVRHLLTHRKATKDELQQLIPKGYDAIIISLLKDKLVERTSPGFYQISSA